MRKALVQKQEDQPKRRREKRRKKGLAWRIIGYNAPGHHRWNKGMGMKITGYLRAVTGVPDADRGYFVLQLTYRNHDDDKQETITLGVKDVLAGLAAVCKDGLEWYASQTRDDDEETLRRER
jgi:hypothetical protein